MEEARRGLSTELSDFDIEKHPDIKKAAKKLFAEAGLEGPVRKRTRTRILFATRVYTGAVDGQGDMCELARVLMSAILRMMSSP
eukprot:ANDGO_07149.mRNA.1 hypothetical protein